MVNLEAVRDRSNGEDVGHAVGFLEASVEMEMPIRSASTS